MSASAAPAERRGANLASLPASALVTIFSKCTMSERLQRLSLVCKEWRQLCATPSLVRRVAVNARGDDDALQRMRSLQLWLARHWGPETKQVPNAAAVEELTLLLRYLSEDAAEIQQLIATAAVSCGPQLRQIIVRLEGHQQSRLVLSSWLCGLTGLTRLDVAAAGVQCPVSLAGLTALEHLTFRTHASVHPTGSWLPPNLTQLRWGITELPEQATSLQQLRHVHLISPTAAVVAGSAGVIARLALSFCSLTLEGELTAIPHLAAAGGRLVRLDLISTHPALVDIGSISGLTSLVALKIQAAHGVAATTSLQLLSRLRHLYICNGPPNAVGPSQLLAAAPPDQPMMRSLPPGAWLGGLTHLTLSYDVLFGSLGVLPAATRLRELIVLRLQCSPAVTPPGEPQPDWDALCNWLCSHPPLCRLTLDCRSGMPAQLPELMRALVANRPGLSIKVRRANADCS